MKSRKPSKLAEEIFEDIRHQILSGALPNGSRLAPERELSVRYRTNRNTLREALRKLEHDRLVQVRHGRGVTVSDFRRTSTIDVLAPFVQSATDGDEVVKVLRDMLLTRAVLLEQAATLSAERRTEIEAAQMTEALQAYRVARAAGESEPAQMAYRAFVATVLDSSHSVPLRWAYNPFIDLELDVLGPLLPQVLFSNEMLQASVEMAEAVLRGDGERARREAGKTTDIWSKALAGTKTLPSRPATTTPVAGKAKGR